MEIYVLSLEPWNCPEGDIFPSLAYSMFWSLNGCLSGLIKEPTYDNRWALGTIKSIPQISSGKDRVVYDLRGRRAKSDLNATDSTKCQDNQSPGPEM